MGVKFLAQGNNSSKNPQTGIEPGTSQLPGQCLSRLLLPPNAVTTSLAAIVSWFATEKIKNVTGSLS